ncbi:DNA topoisomerase [Bifidobacterium italicum]|uniref:DNA topoisomerase n=1 Tax=Bifidobacterium italicum TaxID=1960968 RepID=UPI00105655C1
MVSYTNTRFSVGRIQTQTLKIIVGRDRQIESHESMLYWKIIASMCGWKLTSQHFDNHE